MEAASARKTRWHPIPFWGLGWTIGAILLLLVLWLTEQERMLWLPLLLIPAAGAAAFGWPTYVGARRTGSRAPALQAVIWVVAFTVAGVVLAKEFARHHRLARPGDLNINTTETMRERQASFDRWRQPPEVVSSFLFSVAVIVSGAGAAGIASATMATTAMTPRRGLTVVTFGGAATLGIIVGMMVGAAIYFLLPVATFAAGCTAGGITEFARNALLSAADDSRVT